MLILPTSSNLYQTFYKVVRSQRMIFMAGLAGTGKSLLIQQLTYLAHEAGRTVHLMQYDLSRNPFETAENLAKYPEVDGVTHPAIRKAVGLWSRQAVCQWCEQHPELEHLLIGETPLIGNRLLELVQPLDDAAETYLNHSESLFLIPVPSTEVRAMIEASRARTIENPRHEKEKQDAPPHVMEAHWQEIVGLARQMGIPQAEGSSAYHPEIYGGVYEALLKHRHAKRLPVETILQPTQSAYEMDFPFYEIAPGADDVTRIIAQIEESYTAQSLAQSVENWHSIITDD